LLKYVACILCCCNNHQHVFSVRCSVISQCSVVGHYQVLHLIYVQCVHRSVWRTVVSAYDVVVGACKGWTLCVVGCMPLYIGHWMVTDVLHSIIAAVTLYKEYLMKLGGLCCMAVWRAQAIALCAWTAICWFTERVAARLIAGMKLNDFTTEHYRRCWEWVGGGCWTVTGEAITCIERLVKFSHITLTGQVPCCHILGITLRHHQC